MDDRIVEILESRPGEEGKLLHKIYDSYTGTYQIPVPLDQANDVNVSQDMVKRKLLESGETYETHQLLRVAIIDTGLMSSHPWINPLLEESVDFTGEGPEDLNGHGTAVALIVVNGVISLIPRLRLLNVKVMDSDGRGTEETLIKGIQWAVQRKAVAVNISVGIYRKKWGLFECKGDCKLCRSAEIAAKAGVAIYAAAGNERGKTYCPATVGVRKKDSGVHSVAASDYSNSGIGNRSENSRNIFVPLG
jgi:subtilisin family serine protease